MKFELLIAHRFTNKKKDFTHLLCNESFKTKTRSRIFAISKLNVIIFYMFTFKLCQILSNLLKLI